VWERAEPSLRAPHDRLAAAEAWFACPCAEHAESAGRLAFANGDDDPLGFTSLVVDGKYIESAHAIDAHWASDNAASAAWCPNAHERARRVRALSALVHPTWLRIVSRR